MNKILFITIAFFLILTTDYVSGQGSVIKVVDKKTGEPIPYSHVCFENINDNTQSHTMTNENGEVNYLIENPTQIAISYVGYETLNDTLLKNQDLILELKPTIHDMDEVVVTAQYSPQKKDQSIYKIKVIGSKQIKRKKCFQSYRSV